MTQPATVGSDLLYTYAASDHCKPQAVGQSRPAKVVRSWGSCYNVQVFTDGVNDFDDKRLVLHLTSIAIADCVAKGRLHWAGSPVEAVAPAPEETSAPEGASSEDPTDVGAAASPPTPVESPAMPEAPKPSPKKKPGRPKKSA